MIKEISYFKFLVFTLVCCCAIREIRNHDNANKEWTDEELKKLYETHERLLDLVSLFCYVPRAKYLPLGPVRYSHLLCFDDYFVLCLKELRGVRSLHFFFLYIKFGSKIGDAIV